MKPKTIITLMYVAVGVFSSITTVGLILQLVNSK